MVKDQDLYTFFCDMADTLTEEWYESLDKSKGGVYGSTNIADIQKLKSQNNAFHLNFCKIFDKSNDLCLEDFNKWIDSIAHDEGHQSTPIEEIIGEFFRTQKQYMDLIEKYVLQHHENISFQQIMTWTKEISDSINQIILKFTIRHSNAVADRLKAQQSMIMEMSAPIISLTREIGFLPLVGEIDTYRARVIFEKALSQSSSKQLKTLFIDLSGVPFIDTMVAHQIFQLISGLKLIGVHAAISGISPAIAQTAIQLGLNFSDIKVYGTLSQAMNSEEFSAF